MAIASMDDIVAALAGGQSYRHDWLKMVGTAALAAGRWYDTTLFAGNPTADGYTGTNLTFKPRVDTDGVGIYHGGDVAGATKHLINWGAATSAATGVPNVLQLVDILGYYHLNTLASTALQTLLGNGAGSPLPRYTDGAGVRAYLVCRAPLGAATPNITISYTNQDGVSGRTMPFTISGVNSPGVSHIVHSDASANKAAPFLPLQAGDTGIRRIDSFQLSASYLSGSAALVLCKPLASLPVTTLGVMAERNLLTQLPSLPRIYDGASLSMLLMANATTVANTPYVGYCEFVWN